MKMFYNLGPRNSILLTNMKRPNSSFLRILSFGVEDKQCLFCHISFLKFYISVQSDPMKHQVNNPNVNCSHLLYSWLENCHNCSTKNCQIFSSEIKVKDM